MNIGFLSDYGLQDEFVGVVHGVIARIAPEVRVIDIGHGIPRQDVAAGARVLARALPYLPAGVALAVVDPEVGARRRALALRTAEEDRVLVGPDNGLLVPAAERFGGIVEAVDVSASPWRLEPLSATFHGRDIFAPVAAFLARGGSLADAGTPIDPEEVVTLAIAGARVEDGSLVASVAAIDGFGNIELDADHADMARADFRLGRAYRVRGREARFVRAFADVAPGDLLLYEDSGGHLAIAVNTGDAGRALAVSRGDELRIDPAG